MASLGAHAVGAAPARGGPRVAVCINGLARNPRQNVRFLRAFMGGVDADVFFHFWDTPDAGALVEGLAPVAYEFEPQERAPRAPAAPRREKFAIASREAVIASQHYSLGRANALKRAYEAANGFRYDLVVRLRLDFFTVERLADVLARRGAARAEDPELWARTIYVPHQAHGAGLNDQFAVGSSAALDAYSTAGAAFPAFAAAHYTTAEYFLLHHVRAQGLRIRTFPFEYVLLRDEDVSTFAIERLARDTREHWWSAPLPEVAQELVEEFLVKRASSAERVDAFDLETPKSFLLRTASRGYACYDPARDAFSYARDAAGASRFLVIVAGDELDRTRVNIRPRDLLLGRRSGGFTGRVETNLAPDRSGRVGARHPANQFSEFFVGGDAERGVTFEWIAGYWRTPVVDQAAEAARAARGGVLLVAAPDGLALGTPGDGPAAADARFWLERVPDAAAERSHFGYQPRLEALCRSPDEPVVADTSLGRLFWLGYRAARAVEDRGVRALARGLAGRLSRRR